MSDKRPSPDSRILILGAGPAGIHMGHELRKRGFKHIRVLEQFDRLGGKVLTLNRDGLPFDLGAGLLPGRSAIHDLCLDLGIDLIRIPTDIDLIRIPKVTRGLPEIAAEYRQFKALVARLDRNIRQLTPDPPLAAELSVSFATLLKAAGLLALNELCSNILYTYGYGTTEEVPAYYGVLFSRYWMNDVLANNLLMVKDGYASVFEKMAAAADLDVATSTKVVSIDEENRSIALRRHGQEASEGYDFLINSIPHLVCGDSARVLFDEVEMADYPIFLVRGPRSRVVSEFNPEPHPYAVNFIVHPTTLRLNGPNPEAHELFVTYQAPDYSKQLPGRIDHRPKLMNDLAEFHGKDPRTLEILHGKLWRYFPRLPRHQIAQGLPWAIRDRQGERRTWHIGAACCFESVPNVVEYNLDLLNRFEL